MFFCFFWEEEKGCDNQTPTAQVSSLETVPRLGTRFKTQPPILVTGPFGWRSPGPTLPVLSLSARALALLKRVTFQPNLPVGYRQPGSREDQPKKKLDKVQRHCLENLDEAQAAQRTKMAQFCSPILPQNGSVWIWWFEFAQQETGDSTSENDVTWELFLGVAEWWANFFWK